MSRDTIMLSHVSARFSRHLHWENSTKLEPLRKLIYINQESIFHLLKKKSKLPRCIKSYLIAMRFTSWVLVWYQIKNPSTLQGNWHISIYWKGRTRHVSFLKVILREVDFRIRKLVQCCADAHKAINYLIACWLEEETPTHMLAWFGSVPFLSFVC